MENQDQHYLSFSFKSLFYILASIILFVVIMHFGRTLLVPIAFALLLSFILYPLCSFFERKGVNRLWGIIWSFLSVIIILLVVIGVFSTQIVAMTKEFGNFTGKLWGLLGDTARIVNQIPFVADVDSGELVNKLKEVIGKSGNKLISGTLSATGDVLTGMALTAIYTFFLLLYRSGLRRAILQFANEIDRPVYAGLIGRVQKVGQQYLTGMFLLILILGALNTTGLFLLGIDYALFFGYLAAFLALVPYVGTTLGGTIPTVYAFFNYDSLWYPAGVVLIFGVVQFLEGNFLNPKIVGGNLKLNAMVAIVSLIAGGLLWGIPGMILFLPFAAIFKEVCKCFKTLEPISFLLTDDLHKEKGASDDVEDNKQE